MPVSSRFLVGVGAWLLGAVAATTGSMIAVSVLAHGLLNAQAQQLGGPTVTADFDRDGYNVGSAPTVSASPTTRASSPAPKVTHSARPSATAAASGSPPQSSAGTLLESSAGSVLATCKPAGAYLLYWSPDQGYRADDVIRGPAAVASVVFQSLTSSVVMRVSCSGGTPIAHIYRDE